jgi:hypothetical protein
MLETAHVVSSVGWLGAVVVFLALASIGLTSQDPQTVRGVYILMEPTAWTVLVPLAFGSLITGIPQGLGTTWGLFRHYWVLFKLLITVFATIALLTLRVALKNELSEATTIHWHGLPVPNRMDGVPGATQDPIAPGETFLYEFPAWPSGTYVYHSHVGYQLDQGLYGSLIVEAKEEPGHDREFVLLIEDWAARA